MFFDFNKSAVGLWVLRQLDDLVNINALFLEGVCCFLGYELRRDLEDAARYGDCRLCVLCVARRRSLARRRKGSSCLDAVARRAKEDRRSLCRFRGRACFASRQNPRKEPVCLLVYSRLFWYASPLLLTTHIERGSDAATGKMAFSR
jgi:hypothetical protein